MMLALVPFAILDGWSLHGLLVALVLIAAVWYAANKLATLPPMGLQVLNFVLVVLLALIGIAVIFEFV